MPELNGCEFVIDNKYKIGLGFIDKEVHVILQDFENLWFKVEDDNNCDRNYKNHIATWYGDVDYAYTGVRHKAQKMPVFFQRIARHLESKLVYPIGYFNSLLANLYINKGIAPHSDDEPIFMNNDKTIGAVATVSLGETAVVTIARNDRSKDFQIKLTDGSCYLMPEGNFQNEYKHSVSAPSRRRISLTFRHIP
ncbi:uncharacterized protein METZ01_LOCUS135473 [marine metagenome]|uniref:Fe2OG dioxygenase domain-containing protein n=1 Tax=marine metagenome TaxID=408172 RepID=A0A381Z096_9ZZZZ